MNKGFADLYLEPFLAKYPDLPYGYLIELKYVKRDELTEKVKKKEIKNAREQLEKYRQDDSLQKKFPKIKFIPIILLFHGWELVHQEEVRRRPPSETPAA